jgi:hypothetical protein
VSTSCHDRCPGTVREAEGEEDPNTVFSCQETETCCTKMLKPACCAEKPMDEAVQEQITLWGTLLSKEARPLPIPRHHPGPGALHLVLPVGPVPTGR